MSETERTTVTDHPASAATAERTTTNLTPRSVRAMNNLVCWTGHTKTDTVNRALQIYEFIQQITENGGTVHVRQAGGAELERLTFF
jgi:hypothetical protein